MSYKTKRYGHIHARLRYTPVTGFLDISVPEMTRLFGMLVILVNVTDDCDIVNLSNISAV